MQKFKSTYVFKFYLTSNTFCQEYESVHVPGFVSHLAYFGNDVRIARARF